MAITANFKVALNIIDTIFLLLVFVADDVVETSCRIAHILGVLLMISYCLASRFSNIIIVVCLMVISRSDDAVALNRACVLNRARA